MKIAISGAGVAGPAAAFWLKRQGHDVTLIERAPAFRTGGYIIDFWGVGYTVAEKMGLLPAIFQAGYHVEYLKLVNQKGQQVGGFPTELFRDITQDRFVSLPRGDLAHAIFQQVQDQVETRFDNSITALEEKDSHIKVSLQNGEPLEVDLVIGADGLHSNVRELVFGPQSQFEKDLGYFVAAFEVQGYQPREELVYVSHSLPGRQIARFSLRDDRTLFLFVFKREYLTGPQPHGSEACRQALREIFSHAGWECPQILQAMENADGIYFDRVSQIRMETWSKGRVILLGDAAACVSLLAGEGTGLALTEAYVLAGELQKANGDYQQAFQAYETKLRPFLTKKQRSAQSFAKVFAPKTAFGIWFRNVITRLFRFKPLAHYLLARDLQDDFSLPDYDM